MENEELMNPEKSVENNIENNEQNNEEIIQNNIENNLVRLSAEEQYSIYLKGLENSVEQFKINHPDKYEKAQLIGDDMMNKKYQLNSGQDLKGDFLKCKNILNSVLQYGLEKSDLYESEIELLKKILNDVLNIVNDINDIFEKVEEIERVISILVNKITEIENDY
jgi:hypothetical protein